MLTLLSDFGLKDVYVAVMKGTIAQINPHLTLMDLTHQIPPQNIAAARFQLMNAYPYFPEGTVHLAVVDPGVGSSRRAIAVQLESGFLVAPDNGLVSGVLSQFAAIAAVELTQSQYWRVTTPSSTFHGRDIFAPVAAHLASGVPLQALGNAIDPATIVQLPLPAPIQTGTTIQGVIQAIDQFGNLITNIPGSLVTGKSWTVEIQAAQYPGSSTYSDASPGAAIALIGSHGWVEIAVNGGNAQTRFNLREGNSVVIRLDD